MTAHTWLPLASQRPTQPNPHGFGVGIPIGSHKVSPLNPFRFAPTLIDGGWDSVVDKAIQDSYRIGFRYFVMHRPFGESDGGDQMDFDSRVDIMDSGHPHRSLVSHVAITRKLRRVRHKCPGLVLNAYLGSLADKSFEDREGTGSWAAWMRRFIRSFGPYLNSPIVDITFDASTQWEPGSPQYHAIRWVKAVKERQGRKVFAEAVPYEDRPWAFDMPALCIDPYWRRLTKAEGEQAVMSRQAEVAVWFNGHAIGDNDFNDDPLAWAAHRNRSGIFPILDYYNLNEQMPVLGGRTPASIIAGNLDNIRQYSPGNGAWSKNPIKGGV